MSNYPQSQSTAKAAFQSYFLVFLGYQQMAVNMDYLC